MIENPDTAVPDLSIHTPAGQAIAGASIRIRQQEPFRVVVNGQAFETREVMMGLSAEQQARILEKVPQGFQPAAMLTLDALVAICADCHFSPDMLSVLAAIA